MRKCFCLKESVLDHLLECLRYDWAGILFLGVLRPCKEAHACVKDLEEVRVHGTVSPSRVTCLALACCRTLRSLAASILWATPADLPIPEKLTAVSASESAMATHREQDSLPSARKPCCCVRVDLSCQEYSEQVLVNGRLHECICCWKMRKIRNIRNTTTAAIWARGALGGCTCAIFSKRVTSTT